MARITLTASDGSGKFSGYMAMPNKTPAAAIILIQEIFGVNADMRAKCDAFAKEGYIAICPDLFWRQEPGVDLTDKSQEEWDKALALMNGFDVNKGIDDLKAALAYARDMPECTKKVGCVGYCLGGKLAYLMASRTDIDVSVGYYGVGLEGLLAESGNIKKPLVLHIAELDKFSDEEAREKIIAHFAGSPHVITHVYPGVDHAFARRNGDHYDEAAAKLANRRTDDIFTQMLKG